MMDRPMFRIMRGTDIPWHVIAPCEKQAMRNHGQTLKRLHERGGLSPAEAIAVLTGLAWREIPKMGTGEADLRLAEIVAERTTTTPKTPSAEERAKELAFDFFQLAHAANWNPKEGVQMCLETITQAIEAEREACAVIAEKLSENALQICCIDLGDNIAEAIRDRSHPNKRGIRIRKGGAHGD